MELTLKATDQNMQTLNDFIHSALPADCNQKVLNEIDLAVEEIFVNIAHYAYGQENTDNEAKILCELNNDLLTVSFIDSGTPFNPLDRPDPDITQSAEERRIGGLGIYLTKKFMTSVKYSYKNGHNILTIEKRII